MAKGYVGPDVTDKPGFVAFPKPPHFAAFDETQKDVELKDAAARADGQIGFLMNASMIVDLAPGMTHS